MITRHAKRRMKQRIGVNKKNANVMLQRAIDEGITHSQAKGRLREWMDADDSLDKNLREYVKTDRDYISYRFKRLSRHKDPQEDKKKLAEELRGFVPDKVLEMIAKMDIPNDTIKVYVRDTLTIEVKYHPDNHLNKGNVSEVKEAIKKAFSLEVTFTPVHSVMLPESKESSIILKMRFKANGYDPDLINQLIVRKDIYESVDGSCVFVGSDCFHIPKHASINNMDGDEMEYIGSAKCSSDEYPFSILGKSEILNVFSSEMEILSYISLQRRRGNKDESYIVVRSENTKALSRIIEEHPEISKIKICGRKIQYGFEVGKEISARIPDDINVVWMRPTLECPFVNKIGGLDE